MADTTARVAGPVLVEATATTAAAVAAGLVAAAAAAAEGSAALGAVTSNVADLAALEERGVGLVLCSRGGQAWRALLTL